MSHPYTTIAKVKKLVRGTRVAKLLDRSPEDGTEDTDLFDASEERACVIIDSRLGAKWSVPFDETPDTPAMVSMIADHLVAAALFAEAQPNCPEALYHLAQADGYMTGLVDGIFILPGVTPSDDESAAVVVSVEASSPTFAGTIDDDYTDEGTCPRFRG